MKIVKMQSSGPRAAGSPPSTLRLRISPAAEKQIRAGHPWVYEYSIRDQNRTGIAGEIAIVYDRQNRFLAAGLFDPDSPIRFRSLFAGKPEVIDRAWWARRLSETAARRDGLFDAATTGYRIIHGESDGWPGLVLDRYDTSLVLKLYSTIWIPRLAEIASLILDQLKPQRLVLRLSRNVQSRHSGRGDGEVLAGAMMTDPIVFLENGLKFEADIAHGQKTGFFLDQRENRRRIEALARGRRALNAFSFTGGFSLYAARGGAVSVTNLDVSQFALEGAERNFKLNQHHQAVCACARESVRADALDWLTADSGRKFDLVILDPPSFAKREAERAGAIRAYEHLAASGIERLRPGGILLACSCSAHVNADEFFSSIRRAARNSGRRFGEIETTRHPRDHPATFSEAQYLKAIYLRF